MTLARALGSAAVLMLCSAAPVWAQDLVPFPDDKPAAQQPAGLVPFPENAPSAGQQQQADPKCVTEFTALRDATAKRAQAIQAASERKASPQEACNLFNSMVTAEAKFVKYAVDNGARCGIPAEVPKQLNANHGKTKQIRSQVCRAAAGGGPAAPAVPRLSDALSAPTANSNNVRTGRGTFDTLTGTPLGGAR